MTLNSAPLSRSRRFKQSKPNMRKPRSFCARPSTLLASPPARPILRPPRSSPPRSTPRPKLLNSKYQRWLDANAAIGAKHDHVALIGGEFKPYGEAHPGALLASVLHPDVETANRLNIIAPRGARCGTAGRA